LPITNWICSETVTYLSHHDAAILRRLRIGHTRVSNRYLCSNRQ